MAPARFHNYWRAVGEGGRAPSAHGSLSVQVRGVAPVLVCGLGWGAGRHAVCAWACLGSRQRSTAYTIRSLQHATILGMPVRMQDAAAAILQRVGELSVQTTGRFLQAATGEELPW